MHYFNDTLPSAYIGLSEDFPALCTTTPSAIKSNADKWRKARAIALDPLRVAARIAKDTSEAAAIAHKSYILATAAARKADAECEYRYRKRQGTRSSK